MTDLTVLGDPTGAVNSNSLVSGLQAALRQAIVTGALDPGYRLREIPLANYFGVSTTPIREALRQLEAEGLVTLYPRRGAVVAQLDVPKVAELYEIRLVLEPYAAGQAALRQPSHSDLVRLRGIASQQAEWQRLGDSSTQPIDADFHHELVRLSGNATMAAEIERITRQIETVLATRRSQLPDGLAHAVQAHSDLVGHLANGDADSAARAMRDHLTAARDMVLTALGSEPETRSVDH